MSNIKVLIVDDSPTLRSILRRELESQPDISVVGEASDPLEARDAIKKLNPDVLTLDVEMPKMNGLEFLRRLMQLRPMPVIMVSSLTQRSTEATIRSLELGAIGCLGKPANVSAPGALKALAPLVREAAKSKIEAARSAAPTADTTRRTCTAQRDNRIIMIGASTGGVEAVLSVLKQFPEDCPPTLITQHIPENFSRSFATRLDGVCAPRVLEAEDGLPLKRGQVVIAPGGETHLGLSRTAMPRCQLTTGPKVSGHRPSVDALFTTGLQFSKRIAAALLTGMGQDGAQGLLQLRQAGATTYGQNEATSVVYGMPRVAHELGAVGKQLPLDQIARHLIEQPLTRGRRAVESHV